MKKIKFRAWDKKINRLLPVIKISFQDREVTYYESEDYEDGSDWQHLDDVELMQYIGLKDKNGKEIYEGDIVKSTGYNNTGVVEYLEIRQSDDMTAPGIGFQFPTYPGNMEVIGNIYENKELLK